MSRHRTVRNLNLDDELDDHAIDSGDEDVDMDMDDVQQAQMASGLMAVHSQLGPSTTISDKDIKDALWNYYFDVDESVAYLKDEQKKKDRAAEAKQKKTNASQPSSTKPSRPTKSPKKPSAATLPLPGPVSQLRQDLEGLNLIPSSSSSSSSVIGSGVGKKGKNTIDDDVELPLTPPTPTINISKEKILEEVRRREADEKPVLSLVVVGHVDAGKSTLMGRMLHELGVLSDRALESNQRQSQKIGKASFAYAWTFDATDEERARGVTIDVAIDGFETKSKRFTLIDAPGHRDFIPNMISGAAQADTAVLVIDGSNGGFERGFDGGGQTREHAILVRSLGVQQLVVAVNKLDTVGWAQSRFEGIKAALTPFLAQVGFNPSKVTFIPVGATSGENLVQRNAVGLTSWYDGPTLVQQLDLLEVPSRALEAPLRIPVSNVFRGQSATTSGLAISGRVESGIVQVGEQLAVLPGDAIGTVRSIEVDGALVPWTVAGVNTTIYLAGVDPRSISVGCVLCPPNQLAPVVSAFTAQIIVFDIGYPITAGAGVELFHHSQDIPATISSLEATLDKSSGAVLKTNPRMLTKGTSARIQVHLRPPNVGAVRRAEIPLETFAVNKSMGRVLFRRGGETIAAGIVTSLSNN